MSDEHLDGNADGAEEKSYLDSPFLDPAAMAFLYKPPPARKQRLPKPVYREPKITETDRQAWAEWEAHGFTTVERDIWIEAGLGRFNSLIAKLCRDEGLTPDDLNRKIHGQRAAQLLRSGTWSPSSLAAYLRSESA